jgi:hypothetical protein
VKTLSISLAITITLAATGASATRANTAVYGAYDPRQQESLWNTAIELQTQGRHEEAIPVLKRATHLSRISDGLNAASQLPYVRAEIQSYRALDELALADERHAYLSRIEKQVLPSGPEKIDALLRQAEWHQYALLEDIDEEEAIQARMGKAWNFYRRALNESVATYGESSAELLPALHGMVRAQYLLAGHQGVGAAMPGNMRRERTSPSQSKAVFKRGISLLIAMQQLNRDRLVASREVQAEDLIRMGDWAWWTGNRNFAFEFYGDAIKLANGEALNRGAAANAELAGEEDVKNALAPTDAPREKNEAEEESAANERATADATETLPNGSLASSGTAEATQEESADSVESNPEAFADTASEAGAIDTPVSAIREASTKIEASEQTEASEQLAEAEAASGEPATEKFPTFRILEAPVPLPAIEGFDPVLKMKTEPPTEADLIVTFTVNANGKVDNLERVQVPESAGPRSPDRVLRRLRRLRFRPVFEAGEPIESEPITWVFGPEHWASPYDSVAEAST